MTMNYRWLTFLMTGLAGLSMPDGLVAQRLPFRNYTIRDGLSQSKVSCILQDDAGYLWFGTMGGGVSRFDGISFTNYTMNDGLLANTINCLYRRPDGAILIGTNDGVNRYDGRSFTTFLTEPDLPHKHVNCIYEDSRGNLWIGTNQGICIYDGIRAVMYTMPSGDLNERVLSILEDAEGAFWIGGLRGVYRFDGSAFVFDSVINKRNMPFVRDIHTDATGALWFGATNGLFRYDGVQITEFSTANGLLVNEIRRITVDSAGNLWVATRGGGASKFDGQTFVHYTIQEGLANNYVEDILEDSEGNLWFATQGGGVSRLSNLPIRIFTMDHGLAYNDVTDIIEDRAGNLWIGTDGGGVSRYNGRKFTTFNTHNGLADNRIEAILEDHHGRLWFGTSGRGVSRFDGTTFRTYTTTDGLAHNWITAIIEDRRHNLWFGTNGEGVSMFDGRRFRTFRSQRGGLINNMVTSLLEDKNGHIWIGTNGGGVSRYDGEKFVSYTWREGIDSWIRDICLDDNGEIWFATWDGINQWDGTSLYKYTADNGIPSHHCEFILQHANQYYLGSARGLHRFQKQGQEFDFQLVAQDFTARDHVPTTGLKDSRGRLWFGTKNGLIGYDPAADRPVLPPPPVHITRVSTDGQTLVSTELLTLNHNTHDLQFDFAGLSYIFPENVRYRYKMHPIDTGWIETEHRTASYTRLPPGDYVFLVEARNTDGIWSAAPAQTAFIIRPPFWETWWFRLGCLLVLVATVVGAHRLRTRMYKRRAEVLERSVMKRTSELQVALAELQRARDELEARVQERTAQLMQTINQLQSEIIERMQAEEKIRELNQFCEKIIDNADIWLSVFDSTGNVLVWNKAAEHISGYTREEMVGQQATWERMFPHDAEREVIGARISKRSILPDDTRSHETTILSRSGDQKIIVWSFRQLLGEGGRFIGSICLGRDITERKLAEDQLKIYQKQLRTMASEMSMVEERERRRIAVDLHDRIGQMLTLAKYQLEVQNEKLDTQIAGTNLSEIVQLIDQTIQHSRSLSLDLSPPFLYELGLEPAIEWLAEQYQAQFGFCCIVTTKGTRQSVHNDLRIFLYRAMQELLLNVAKHAHAGHVEILIEYTGSQINVIVSDDGTGYRHPVSDIGVSKNGGFGIFSMRERLHLLGGELSVTNTTGGGLCVSLYAPLQWPAGMEIHHP